MGMTVEKTMKTIGTKHFFLLLLLNMAFSAARAVSYSGTLPVVFINTTSAIESKTDYVDATFYLDPMGIDGYEAIGSADDPFPLKIRGRGNYTWYGPFEKKAYKIKLESGLPLLGMPKNKHFALLAHADGGQTAFFRNTAGFELGRLVGLEFTPQQRPVELVLNGDYRGLYFLTETVRVGQRRVNIAEQQNRETDPELITGGWLVEIDNVNESWHQIIPSLAGTELTRFRVTYHSPDTLSTAQRQYLSNQIKSMLRTVYVADKNDTEWEQFIDLDALARYYLVVEMLDHVEAFLGSCYLYKDRGEMAWKFGPLWDLGHAFNGWHPKNRFLYQYKHESSADWDICIMEELAKFPRLQERIKKLWNDLSPTLYPTLTTYLRNFASQIAEAAACDYERWPDYGTADTNVAVEYCLNLLEQKYQFLENQWSSDYSGIEKIDKKQPDHSIYDLQGRRLNRLENLKSGIYLKGGKKILIRKTAK